MRFRSVTGLFCFMLGGLLALGGMESARGQKFDPKGKKPPQDTKITEIGGRSIEQWIKDIKSEDRSKGEIAIQAVQQFHPDRAYEAVPALLAELEKHNPLSTRIDVSILVNATIAIGNILGKGGVNDPEPRHIERAVKVLNLLMKDNQSIVKLRATTALGQLGPEAKSAIPVLLSAIRDPNTWEIRKAATLALGAVAVDPGGKKPPPVEVVTALARALGDKASAVRMSAIQSLIHLGGPGAASHRNQLIKYLEPVTTTKEPEATVRIWAHIGIMALSDEISDVRVGAVAKYLDHSDAVIRIQAAQALGRLGPKAKSTVPKLIPMILDDKNAEAKNLEVLFWGIWALGRMEGGASRALPAIRCIMDDPNCPPPIKKVAQESIDSILGKTKTKTSPKIAPSK